MSDELTRIEMAKSSAEDLRDALAHLKPDHPNLTLRAALERGAELVVRELELYFNGGRPFPRRNGTGRDSRIRLNGLLSANAHSGTITPVNPRKNPARSKARLWRRSRDADTTTTSGRLSRF